MTRGRCDYCRRTATHTMRGYDLCELHYAKVDEGRAMSTAIAARDHPPWKRLERLHLVVVLEEMLGSEELYKILGRTKWFIQIEEVRAMARNIFHSDDEGGV